MEKSPQEYEELLKKLEDKITSLIINLDFTLAKIDERRPNKTKVLDIKNLVMKK